MEKILVPSRFFQKTENIFFVPKKILFILTTTIYHQQFLTLNPNSGGAIFQNSKGSRARFHLKGDLSKKFPKILKLKFERCIFWKFLFDILKLIEMIKSRKTVYRAHTLDPTWILRSGQDFTKMLPIWSQIYRKNEKSPQNVSKFSEIRKIWEKLGGSVHFFSRNGIGSVPHNQCQISRLKNLNNFKKSLKMGESRSDIQCQLPKVRPSPPFEKWINLTGKNIFKENTFQRKQNSWIVNGTL